MTIEELLENAEKYAGKEVTIRGYFQGGHEVSKLVSKIEEKTVSAEEQEAQWRKDKEVTEKIKDKVDFVKDKKQSKEFKPYQTWFVPPQAQQIDATGVTPEGFEPPTPYLAEVEATGIFDPQGKKSFDSTLPQIKISKVKVLEIFQSY